MKLKIILLSLIFLLFGCSSLDTKINNDLTTINNSVSAVKESQKARKLSNLNNGSTELLDLAEELVKSALFPEFENKITSYEAQKLSPEQIKKVNEMKNKLTFVKNYLDQNSK